VEVEIARASGPEALPGRRQLARELWFRAEPAPPLSGPDDMLRWRWRSEQAEATRPEPEWSTASIAVEGAPVEVAWLAEGEHWVACAGMGAAVMTVWAAGLPPEAVKLARLTAVGPYVEGSRARHARLMSERGDPSTAGRHGIPGTG